MLDDPAVAITILVLSLIVGVEVIAHRQCDRALRFGFVHLPIAEKRPDFAPRGVGQAPVV